MSLYSFKKDEDKPRILVDEPSFKCCDNIIVLSPNVPYEQQELICPQCHRVWKVVAVAGKHVIAVESGKAPRTPRWKWDGDEDGYFDANGGGCPPPPECG